MQLNFLNSQFFPLVSLAEIHKMQIDFLHWDWFVYFLLVTFIRQFILFGLFLLRILQTTPRDFFHGCKFKCADITEIKLGQVEFSTFCRCDFCCVHNSSVLFFWSFYVKTHSKSVSTYTKVHR